jgi:hypothetical protein
MPDLTYLGEDLPVVGGSQNTWGNILNTILSAIDSELSDINDLATAALPATGGAMTGNLFVLTDTYESVDLGDLDGGTVSLNMNLSRFFYADLVSSTTLSFTNPPASGDVCFFMLEITDTSSGAASITWPGSVDWPGGSPPTITSDGVDVIAFYSRDGGTTWRGAVAQADSQ